MQTIIDRPTARPAPLRRRPTRIVVSVIVLAVAVATTTVALVLQLSAGSRIDRALGQLRSWPSVAVTGYLTGDAEPVRMQATITADGAAQGVLVRPSDAQAEFVTGPSGTLLRGNAQWWLDEPGRAERLADHWVRDPGGSVAPAVLGQLTPAALADALAGMREPTGRTATQVDVNGSLATEFARDRFRLVVGWTGRPLALVVPTLGGPTAGLSTTIADRTPAAPGAADPTPAWSASIAVERPAGDRAAAIRRAIDDVVAAATAQYPSGTVPTLNELAERGSAEKIVIESRPDPRGCAPTRCALRARVRNTGVVEQHGVFTVRVNHVTVSRQALTLPPGGSADLTTRPSPAFLAGLPDTRVLVEYGFDIDS